MKTILLSFFLVCATLVSAQTPISGIINQYAAIISIDPCSAGLEVSSTDGFEVGQRILLIQMKGATIDIGNNAQFGTITDLGTAGLYEQGIISNINGNTIFLENILINDYDLAGALQIMTFPEYEDAIIEAPLTALDWDGEKGGILAFTVQNTLEFQADIDLNGKGFQGGAVQIIEGGCQWFLEQDNYYYEEGSWRGALKGEGIAQFIFDREAGRGPQANGGGGGNDHNAGGGGGGNQVPGGLGGIHTPPGIFFCDGDYPGFPGKGINADNDRLFLGGGGGAGHTDDNGAGSSGGDGGGLLFLQANTIIGNGFMVTANGVDSELAEGDGAGGGGAGGTLVLDVETLDGDLSLEANGGNGANTNNLAERCFGPGGGGAGGRIVYSNVNFTNTSLTGGQPGINTHPMSPCTNDLSQGAMPGEDGNTNTFAGIDQGTETAGSLVLTQQLPPATIACIGEPLNLFVEAIGDMLAYQWQLDMGSGFMDIQDGLDYSGTQTNNLNILNPAILQSGWLFQCVISNDCFIETSQSTEIEIQAAPSADFSINPIDALTIQFLNNSTNFSSLLWDFGDGNTITDINPIHTYMEQGTYEVTLFISNACGVDSIAQTINISDAPFANFTSDFTAGCAPLTVEFEDLSVDMVNSWAWSFPGGDPTSSTLQNPTVSYTTAGTYPVTLIVGNGSGFDTLEWIDYIQVLQPPIPDFDFVISGDTVFLTNLSTGTIDQVNWDFGDGTPPSNEFSPFHIYSNAGTYEITLTLSNTFCASGTSTLIEISPISVNEVKAFISRVFPNPTNSEINILLQPTFQPDQIELYDMSGQKIEVQISRISPLQIQLNLSQLPSGNYNLIMDQINVRLTKI